MHGEEPRWQRFYPPGIRADAELPVFPIHSIVAVAAGRWGGKCAIEFRGREISFDELSGLIDRAARAFVALGVKRGDSVALLLPNTPWHPVAFFGALAAGGVVVHISPLDGARVIEHKLRDSGARVLVTTDVDGLADRVLAMLPDGLVETVVVGADGFWDEIERRPPLRSAKPTTSPPFDGGEEAPIA